MADWFCGFALLAVLFCAPAETMLSAYIEGEAVYVAPLEIVAYDEAVVDARHLARVVARKP